MHFMDAWIWTIVYVHLQKLVSVRFDGDGGVPVLLPRASTLVLEQAKPWLKNLALYTVICEH